MVGALQNPYQKYLKTKVETASQPQLLVMLFEAATKKLHAAKRAIGEDKIEDSHNNLVKVQKISELMVALDFELGGELAKRLFSIYEFVYRRLVDANIQQDTGIIDEVVPIVEQLRLGWTEAVAKFEEDPDAARAEADAARAVAVKEKAEAEKNGPPMQGNVTTLGAQQPAAMPTAAGIASLTQGQNGAPSTAAADTSTETPPTPTASNVRPLRPVAGYGQAAARPAAPPVSQEPQTLSEADVETRPEADRPRLNLQG